MVTISRHLNTFGWIYAASSKKWMLFLYISLLTNQTPSQLITSRSTGKFWKLSSWYWNPWKSSSCLMNICTGRDNILGYIVRWVVRTLNHLMDRFSSFCYSYKLNIWYTINIFFGTTVSNFSKTWLASSGRSSLTFSNPRLYIIL